jgi:NAD(P)H dehydrogenase (quinone)
MQKSIISIVYHSNQGHTEKAAQLLSGFLQCDQAATNLIDVNGKQEFWDQLHASDTLIFGCPTSFGTISAGFKSFMESTDSFWYNQLWKNKFAAGFTVSSCSSGDKLNTLQTLVLFASQHSMLWISPGVLPRFINHQQTDGQNRFASYPGLMLQSEDNGSEQTPFHSGDTLTLELFAARILDVTTKYKHINNNYYETNN